jgi:hypothetical protein
VNEYLVEAFDDVGGGRGCAVARECLRKFVHELFPEAKLVVGF